MSAVLAGMDAALCVLIMLAAMDYLRATYFLRHPAACLAVYMVAIGSFGVLLGLIDGRAPSPWSVLLHLGITVYAAAHYEAIIEWDWQWNGHERRGRQGP
jgi:hypothetical protein